MLTRIITSIVAIALFAAVIMTGTVGVQAAIMIVVLGMIYECSHIMTKSLTVKLFAYIDAILVMLGITVFEQAGLFIALAIGLLMVITVTLHGRVEHKEIFAMGLMTLYISVFMSYIPLTMSRYGVVCMLVIFISAWGSDTGAYFAGSFLGKHKLIPHVSPKKTVEGSIGGIVSAMLCCQILLFVSQLLGFEIEGFTGFRGYAVIGGMGILGSVISQIGDLAASAIKRDCNVKDYGKIFPGHGGFMDRFDSVILIAPVVYYILVCN